MNETTGGERSVEELEAAVLGALDLYFEAQLREFAGTPRRVGPAVEAYEEARRQLAEAEEELEGIRHRTEELKAGAVDAVAGGSAASELGKEISDLGKEISDLQEELRDLTQAEKAAQGRKEDAEESLRRVEMDFEGDLGLAADEVAALALSKVEEVDAFKVQLDQRFAEGRTSILGAAA
jgi:predicted  nucleic acid-binding Zn-ribbon protein